MFSYFKNRRIFFVLSALLIVGGIAFTLIFGVQLDISFRGGSIIEYAFEGSVDLNEMDRVVSAAIGQPVTTQESSNIGDGSKHLVISVSGNEALSSEQLTALTSALTKSKPEAKFVLSSSNLVNPYIGREMLRNGLWAMLIASILIIGYVWFSFRSMSGPSAGVMALVALFHDIVIAFFTFVLMREPLNETLIAVILTILGFSINDTIVIYDRIRENIRLTKGSMPLADLVDQSINQSLSRSINTSLATFVAVAIAFIFATIYGLESIRQFTLPMMIGIISGAYSTIFLAGPLWVMWKTRGGRTGYET